MEQKRKSWKIVYHFMIYIENLKKEFGKTKAVNGLSFEVNKGEVLGFLGPNGAGKSTTMRILTGYFSPNSGNASIGGYNVLEYPKKIKSLIGYLPEDSPVYKEMTPYSLLKFSSKIRKIRNHKNAIEKIIDLCELEDVIYRPIEYLSKGYIQRVCLAQAIIHDPPYLILDEPTAGLDPNQKYQVRNLIKRMSKDKTIIISTHILEEVEVCCSRAIIISGGRIVEQGLIKDLKQKSSVYGVIELKLRKTGLNAPSRFFQNENNIHKIETEKIDKDLFNLKVYPGENAVLFELLDYIVDSVKKYDLSIENITIKDGDLNEVFRKVTKETK